MVTVPGSLALTVFLLLLVPLVVASTLAQYYYDAYRRAQDAIAFMIEEEVDK